MAFFEAVNGMVDKTCYRARTGRAILPGYYQEKGSNCCKAENDKGSDIPPGDRFRGPEITCSQQDPADTRKERDKGSRRCCHKKRYRPESHQGRGQEPRGGECRCCGTKCKGCPGPEPDNKRPLPGTTVGSHIRQFYAYNEEQAKEEQRYDQWENGEVETFCQENVP
jgi:hypothetical protein